MRLVLAVGVLCLAAGPALAQPARCGAPARTVEIRGSTVPWRDLLVRAVGCENTRVVLGPDVDISFQDYDPAAFPIPIRRCVELTSTARFAIPPSADDAAPPFECPPRDAVPPTGPVILRRAAAFDDVTGDFDDLEIAPDDGAPGQARSPRALGPILRFGKHAKRRTFFKVGCRDGELNDGVRITGFRIEGPERGQQSVKQTAVLVDGCTDVLIGNMEIAGWGGGAVAIEDDFDAEAAKATNEDGGRILQPSDVRIVGNYLHNNQFPSQGTAGGYGVSLAEGAWALIVNNVFDYNRHAVATNGYVGGYVAKRNLVLAGGGYHGKWYSEYTHQLDVHGTDHCTDWYWGLGTLATLLAIGVAVFLASLLNPVFAIVVGVLLGLAFVVAQVLYFFADKEAVYNCGYAGFEMKYVENAFQYDNGAAISVRGTPRKAATMEANVFAHDDIVHVGIESYVSSSDAAIHIASPLNIGIMADNRTGVDTLGDYGVCDFDGDGIDDLFLATGVTFWYASSAAYPWSYMNAQRFELEQLRLAYVDGDARCDVIAQFGSDWRYISGGYGDWQLLATTDTPLAEVALGRFDVGDPSTTPGATRRSTHALRRGAAGQWEVMPLANPVGWFRSYEAQTPSGPEIKHLQQSDKPFDKLRFGDFTGDGVTDVLAVVSGKWQISASALEPWRPLNDALGDDITTLTVANMDADDNVDDLLKLELKRVSNVAYEATWQRSKNGTGAWVPVMRLPVAVGDEGTALGFAGRFGRTPEAEVVIMQRDRTGLFTSLAERAPGTGEPTWSSRFYY